jgi:hypothetical protein
MIFLAAGSGKSSARSHRRRSSSSASAPRRAPKFCWQGETDEAYRAMLDCLAQDPTTFRRNARNLGELLAKQENGAKRAST